MNIGDLIICKESGFYKFTDERTLCQVISMKSGEKIKVRIVGTMKPEVQDFCYDVDSFRFKTISLKEYEEMYPDACISLVEKEEVAEIITVEEKENLIKEMAELLTEYNYRVSEQGLKYIINTWAREKREIIELFKKHPNYNGNYQIAFDADYNRGFDQRTALNFAEWLYNTIEDSIKECKIGVFSYKECSIYYNRLNAIIRDIEDIYYIEPTSSVLINGLSLKEIELERSKWEDKIYKYNEFCKFIDNKPVARKDYNLLNNFARLRQVVKYCVQSECQVADKEAADMFNELFPEVKAVEGQKITRIMRKICKITGTEKYENFEREFAKFSDAITPLSIKRHTVISCHPIDYLTMSFGNSWGSCHTIDRENKRNMPNSYEGCRSSGTMSYMLDNSSIIFYTVDKNYEGNQLELQPKINRNMFHIGENKIVQGRVYPQTTDGNKGIYKQIREIVQKIISDLWEVPNTWINKRGTSECEDVIISRGTHYPDYEHFDDCNVSYLKENMNYERIRIGSNPICPCCGMIHGREFSIECEDCE